MVRRWIDEGAKFEIHWAYVSRRGRRSPRRGIGAWPLGAIDRFIATGHDEHGPAARGRGRSTHAVAATVVGSDRAAADAGRGRRLPGRPFARRPTRSWSIACWPRRITASGWRSTGSTWSATPTRCGYHSDNQRDVWLYRDYVIEAFNNNKPFDRFTIEQLAGDLLPGAEPGAEESPRATTACCMTTEEGGAQPKEYTAKYAADRVRNTATAWLGSTMGCCQCHDHKYDPFTTRDFYSFAAFFADVNELAVGRQEQTPMPTAEQAACGSTAARSRKIAIADPPAARSQKLAELNAEGGTSQKIDPDDAGHRSRRRRAWCGSCRGATGMDDSGEIVSPAIPAFLGKLGGRRAAARPGSTWPAGSSPPTIRWSPGCSSTGSGSCSSARGSCKTLDDFGTQGALPTHPELLDWLAVEFRESGWDVKHMVRLMVTSRTYRQSSDGQGRARAARPGQSLARPAGPLPPRRGVRPRQRPGHQRPAVAARSAARA